MSDTKLEFFDTESPDVVENEDGSVDVLLGEPDEGLIGDLDLTDEANHFVNLAEFMNEDDLKDLGRKVGDTYQGDLDSRAEWEEITLDALDNLGIEYIETSEPFDGACTATHPLILENSIKFQSKAGNELLPPQGPVKTQIIGKKTEELEARASRVRNDMNYHLKTDITEYYDETDRALFFMPFLGNSFKRKAWDPEKGRITDEFCLPDRVIVNNNAKNLQSAERISFKDYISPRRLENLIDQGFYRDLEDTPQPSTPEWTEFELKIREFQGITSDHTSFSDVHELIEQQCYLKINETTGELDESAPSRPYLVTILKESQEVLSIYRNYAEADEKFNRLEWFSHYAFVPTAGFYAWGYTHLLGNLQRTITLAMRSLADAGQFSNLPGGFKSETARIVGDNEPVGFGEFKNIELPTITDDIRKVFLPLPFKEPSATLFELMKALEATGQKFADSTEQVIADSTNYGPVGTTMALLEASTRFFSSVYRRAYRAQCHEFKIVSRLIHDYYENSYPETVDPEGEFSRQEDYDPQTLDIIPVSDPNYSSQAQRISKAQVIFDAALKAPQEHNMKEVLREFYKAFEIDDMDKILPPPDKPQMQDPLSDIMSALQSKPISAFKGQDHESHIAVKTAWLQDPAAGGNPAMQNIAPTLQANIREHMFMNYVTQMEAVMAQNKLSLEQAAQRIARLNQIAMEEEQEGSPQYILAKAEELRALTAQSKETRESQQDQYKLGLDTIEKAAQIQEAAAKAAREGVKLDNDLISKGIDLLTAGMKDAKSGTSDNQKETKAKPKKE